MLARESGLVLSMKADPFEKRSREQRKEVLPKKRISKRPDSRESMEEKLNLLKPEIWKIGEFGKMVKKKPMLPVFELWAFLLKIKLKTLRVELACLLFVYLRYSINKKQK